MGRAHVETDELEKFWAAVAECQEAITETQNRLVSACKELEAGWQDDGYGPLDEAVKKIADKLHQICEALNDCNDYVQAKKERAFEYLK